MREVPSPGPMLDALTFALGSPEAVQEAISKRVLEAGPMLRMEAVAQLWEEICKPQDSP